MTTPKDRLAFALDVDTAERALEWARLLAGEVGLLKVGLELFSSEGPQVVHALRKEGARIFLDLKLNDIPNTVRHAAMVAGRLGAELLTVHASAGRAAIEAAVEGSAQGAREVRLPAPGVLAVTVLTSLSDTDLEALGLEGTTSSAALRLAKLAVAAGAHGCVCSPREVAALRQELGPSPLLVVPGIRQASGETHDQTRSDTPAAAVRGGASLLVVGRPIREAADPVARAREIVQEMAAAARG
jgi:orotidine-5'-phosphate decarboxylase